MKPGRMKPGLKSELKPGLNLQIETWEDEIPANAYFASSTLSAGSETKLSPEKEDGE